MAQTPVNTGAGPNTGTGDSLRDAFTKLNNNDADLDVRMQAMAAIIASTVQNPTVQKAMLTAIVAALPTTRPGTAGVLWRNGNIVAIS